MLGRKFNLQPWRAQRREAQKKQFIGTTIVIALICAGALYGYYFLQNQYIEGQEQAKSKLQKDIDSFKAADIEIKKIEKLNQEIERQIETIGSLQAQRGLTVEILDYLANETPENVFLNNISYHNSKLSIHGVAENETGVTAFIRKLQLFPDFSNVKVINIKKAEKSDRYMVTENTEVKEFELNIEVTPKKQKTKEQES